MLRLNILIALGLFCALSGCASTHDGLEQAKSGLQDVAKQVRQVLDPGAAAADLHPGIQETELNQIFAKYPYDVKKSFNQQFPRVSITVLEAPKVHHEVTAYTSHRACFKLSAVVWDTRTKSRNIPNFYVCLPRDLVPNLAMRPAEGWIGSTGFFVMNQEHTGLNRTDGPVPPKSPIPNDLAHQRYFENEYLEIGTVDGRMFAMTLYHMGFNWSIHEDRRVWFKSFPVSAK